MIRLATPADFDILHRIRMAVRENVLSDPSKITRADYEEMLTKRGRGWVYEEGGAIRGFAIADNADRNVWALFVEPGFERRGIGRALMETMMRWMFEQDRKAVWLSTGPDTRARAFYERAGWRWTSTLPDGDLVLQLSWEDYAMEEPPFMLDGARVLEYAAVSPGGGKHLSVIVGGVSLDNSNVSRVVIAEDLVEGGVFLMHCNEEWSTVAAGNYPDPGEARRSADKMYQGELAWRRFRELTGEERKEVETTRAFLRELAAGDDSAI